jgi:hypothetical protein
MLTSFGSNLVKLNEVIGTMRILCQKLQSIFFSSNTFDFLTLQNIDVYLL